MAGAQGPARAGSEAAPGGAQPRCLAAAGGQSPALAERGDGRAAARVLLGALEVGSWRQVLIALACAAVAAAIAFGPLLFGAPYAGLSPAGHRALFILVLAAGLWITEAVPAFATALLVIALELALLGRPGGVLARTEQDWQQFVQPWASPLIWLFFGGLVLAEGARKTGLDLWLTGWLLGRAGPRPAVLLGAVMGSAFTFSMFMSNTATAAMLLVALGPVVRALPAGSALGRALVLAVPLGANLGGMGTLIGTPPNAIAAAALAEVGRGAAASFARWMLYGLPVAAVLALALWGYLIRQCRHDRAPLEALARLGASGAAVAPAGPRWQRLLVMGTFAATVGLWLTQSLHGIPAAVVSFGPITVFALFGLLGVREVRSLSWDVLMLLAGGMALGVAVEKTGLASWLLGLLPLERLSPQAVALVAAYGVALVSNLMSNTAAAAIVLPVVLPLGVQTAGPAALVVPVGLAASLAMCLPISTPPNALAYATERLRSRDFLVPGLLAGLLGPPLAVWWCGRWL